MSFVSFRRQHSNELQTLQTNTDEQPELQQIKITYECLEKVVHVILQPE